MHVLKHPARKMCSCLQVRSQLEASIAQQADLTSAIAKLEDDLSNTQGLLDAKILELSDQADQLSRKADECQQLAASLAAKGEEGRALQVTRCCRCDMAVDSVVKRCAG